MDLPDQPFRDRSAAAQPRGDELECAPVVQELTDVVRVRPGHRLAGEQHFRLLQRQPSSFDVGRVVRLADERPRAHLADPVLGERRRLQEPPRPLDPREIGRDGLGDREARLEAHRLVASRTSILPVTAAEIRAVRYSRR